MKVVIIDDELHGTETLELLLKKYTTVEIVKIFNLPLVALQEIPQLDFDVLFLDIQMPEMNGFELLNALPEVNFHLVVTTAFDSFAIQAFKANALDYLLKPIDKTDLIKTINKLKNQVQKNAPALPPSLAQQINKLALPTISGIELIPVGEVLYLEADSNYVRVYIEGDKSVLVSKTLKQISAQLEGLPFLRVHNSYVINLNKIQKYVRGDGGYVVFENGTSINVSRARKEDLIRALKL